MSCPVYSDCTCEGTVHALGIKREEPQLSLLEALHPSSPPETKARASDPATSQAAARDAFPRAGNQRYRILIAIVESERGLNYDEASAETGIVGVSVSTRISELARAGWIEAAGERETSSGGSATIWVATDKTKEHMA